MRDGEKKDLCLSHSGSCSPPPGLLWDGGFLGILILPPVFLWALDEVHREKFQSAVKSPCVCSLLGLYILQPSPHSAVSDLLKIVLKFYLSVGLPL